MADCRKRHHEKGFSVLLPRMKPKCPSRYSVFCENIIQELLKEHRNLLGAGAGAQHGRAGVRCEALRTTLVPISIAGP